MLWCATPQRLVDICKLLKMGRAQAAPSTCPLLLQNKALIDALGYIDTEWSDPEARNKAQLQIEMEMDTFTPNFNEYLAYLPDYTPTFQGRASLMKEWKRVQAKVALNAIDMNRYNQQSIYEPSRKNAGDANCWKQANDQMKTLIEHRHNE
uniref:PremRNAsplicing factor SPF27 putative n=1 Tax=Albugo laibachii Nc14 TaxID=890382 RepID=F0X129_9STRA|nr:premRNAsplicing factor SPF27 putative [Albugo laibachii Nc14]|eukprot:CCA27481.1 premRNAsplicing factor SPF27 putative [Albugo laibachii Nc14]